MNKCFIVDAFFNNFSSEGNGSVINLENVELTITCSAFQENTATMYGGSIFLSKSKRRIKTGKGYVHEFFMINNFTIVLGEKSVIWKIHSVYLHVKILSWSVDKTSERYQNSEHVPNCSLIRVRVANN